MRYFIPLILFIAIAAFLWKGLQKDPHNLDSALIGKPVVAFNHADLINATHTLDNKIFLGHVSLLNVWATWCITCHAEHPVLMDIARSKAVVIYGLNYKDDLVKANNWLESYGNPYQNIIADPQGKLAIDFGVYGTPETFIIDSQGIIRYRHIGAISPDDWKDTLEPIVKKLS